MQFNRYLFTFINQGATHYKSLDTFFIVATSYYFSLFIFIVVALYIGIYLPYQAQTPLARLKRIAQTLQIAVSVGVVWYIVTALKIIVAIPRPYTVISDAHLLVANTTPLESFPSAHTALLAALATAVYLHHKKLGALLLLLTSVVGLSRIFVGVHYPIDVLFGFLIGFIVPYILHQVFANTEKEPHQ